MNYILILIFIIFILLLVLFLKKPETFNLNPLIPKVIYLSYKTKNIPSYIIPNWKKLYPDYEIKLYDNNDCIDFFKKEYSQLYIDIFNYLKDGPIKADFWRICVLYKYGGIYADIDIEPLVSIETIIEKDTTFLTCISASMKNGITPEFIVSTSNNYILKECIDKYIEMYNNKIEYEYWTYSICTIMRDVFRNNFIGDYNEDGIYYDKKNNKYQLLKEVYPTNDIYDHHCKYNNIKILNNRYKDYTDHSF